MYILHFLYILRNNSTRGQQQESLSCDVSEIMWCWLMKEDILTEARDSSAPWSMTQVERTGSAAPPCANYRCLSRQNSGFGSRSRWFERNKNVSSPSTCESQYCGEPPWPRGSVLGLRPPGLEFRILCLEDSVISIISPSSGGSPGPV